MLLSDLHRLYEITCRGLRGAQEEALAKRQGGDVWKDQHVRRGASKQRDGV